MPNMAIFSCSIGVEKQECQKKKKRSHGDFKAWCRGWHLVTKYLPLHFNVKYQPDICSQLI